MKKNLVAVFAMTIVAMVLCIAIVSCDASGALGTSELRLNIIQEGESRSLTTDSVYTAGLTPASYEYKAICTSTSGAHGEVSSWTTLSVSESSATISKIDRGSWTIHVRAKNSSGGVILQGQASIDLTQSNHTLVITLKNSITDYSVASPSNVTVSIGVTVPSLSDGQVVVRYTTLANVGNLNATGTGGNSVSMTKKANYSTSISGSSIVATTASSGNTAYYGSVNLAPGLYVLQVLYKDSSEVAAGQTMAIHVEEKAPFAINGTLTSGEYIDLELSPISISSNDIELSFSTEPDCVSGGHIGAAVSYTGTVTSPVYKWYVNGILDAGQTGATYTSTNTYASGEYAVSCIVSGTVSGQSAMGYITEDIEVSPANNVGGIIFYVDSTSTGSYAFYNELGARVPAPTVGTDCSNWKYKCTDRGNGRDKYYVYNDGAIVKAGGSGSYSSPFVAWTYLDENNATWASGTESYSNNDYLLDGYKGRVYEPGLYNSVTYNGIGTGRSNTEAMMAITRNVTLDGVVSNTNAYIQGRRVRWKNESAYSETIWYVCDEFNKGTYWRFSNDTGCDDWFVPSIDELSQFRAYCGSPEMFVTKTSTNGSYSYAWSSSAYSDIGSAYNYYVNLSNGGGFVDASYRYSGRGARSLVLARAF